MRGNVCESERETRDLCCARMRDKRVFVLLLPRDVVRLSNHFRGPSHGLATTDCYTKSPSRAPSRVNTPGCSRALVDLRRQYPLPPEWGEDYVNEKDKNRTDNRTSRREFQTATKTDLRDMLSTPTARPSDISPAWMLCAIFLIAMSPEEQSRLMVETGTLSGIPAASAAAREIYKGEGGWQVPSQFTHGICACNLINITKHRSVYPYLRKCRRSMPDSIWFSLE